jgi:hypothetical protein
VSLLKLLAILGVVGIILYETGAVVVNHVQADELGGAVLRAAVQQAESPQGRREGAITEAAETAVARSDRARLVEAALDGGEVRVTIEQDAQVLVLDRLGPLADLATATVTKTATPDR